MKISTELRALRELFIGDGFDIRVVGGAVRDHLMGETPHDIDLATDANPEEQAALYARHGIHCIPTGAAHGTYTVVLADDKYEITSLRAETDHDGRHATMSFTKDWVGDLSRRDLTINAMAWTFDGILIDPFGGEYDLKNGVVKFVGNAEERMTEDYLRIFRYFRFSGRYAKGTPCGEDMMFDNVVEGLQGISRERIWVETKKILEHSSGATIYKQMSDFDVCEHSSLPSIHGSAAFAGFEIAHKFTQNAVTLLAPFAFLMGGVDSLALNLKWSKEERMLGQVVNRLFRATTDELFHALIVKGDRPFFVAEAARRQGHMHLAHVIETMVVPVFPITGADLVKSGMKPGKEMGEKLAAMKEQWFSNNCRM